MRLAGLLVVVGLLGGICGLAYWPGLTTVLFEVGAAWELAGPAVAYAVLAAATALATFAVVLGLSR